MTNVHDPTGSEVSPVQQVAAALDADIYLFSAPIYRNTVECLIEQHQNAQRRTNCVLVLTTYGGDPDAAFILARFLKRAYKKFHLFVFSHCKSAGTLVALGADEIVMAVHGELGPLDVQLFKEDELGLQNSGLDIFQALNILSNQAFLIFEKHFLQIKQKSVGLITTKTAADIATTVATQLLAPISAQIDPLRLGELQRAIDIATRYGERLGAKPETLRQLIYGYPSHTFVIDLEEAQGLFAQVRVPTGDELMLEHYLQTLSLKEQSFDCIREPHPEGMFGCLTQRKDSPEEAHANDDGTERANEEDPQAGGESRSGEVHPGAVRSSGDDSAEHQRDAVELRTGSGNGSRKGRSRAARPSS